MGGKGWAIVGVAAALVLGFFSWEWFLSPEARVKHTLRAAATAAEETDAPALLSCFADDYADFRHVDRAALEKSLKEAFLRFDRLNVTLQAIKVKVDGERAEAHFDLVVVAFSGDDRYVVVGTPFDPEKLTATLRRDASGWKIESVSRGGATR